MNNKIIIINGPNLNLLGEREQSQYGSTTFDELKDKCLKKSNEIGINLEFAQSNIEGELVNLIQNSALSFSVCIEDKFHNFQQFLNEINANIKSNHTIYRRKRDTRKYYLGLF